MIFLVISLIITIIVSLIFVVLLFSATRATKKIIIKAFNLRAKKKKFDKKEEQEFKEAFNPQRQKITGGDFIRNFNTDKEEPDNKEEETVNKIEEGLSRLKSAGSSEEEILEEKMPLRKENQEGGNNREIKMPKQRIIGGDFSGKVDSGKKQENKKQNAVTSFKDKDGKDIEEGLSKLKTAGIAGENTMNSKMPSRFPKPTDDSHQGVKIKTSKDFKEESVIANSGLHEHVLAYDKDKVKAVQSNMQENKKGLIEKMFGDKKSETNSTEGNLKVPASAKGKINKKVKDDGSIFVGENEVSRIDLKHKLRLDPKIWEAQRQVGLTLSPLERAKLEKEVFAPVYGRNISKTDLKLSIKKLSQKMLDAKDPAEHAKIRKQIKFFKKIGGIK
jgi:hypothetical protein